jgi:hypothetical protein
MNRLDKLTRAALLGTQRTEPPTLASVPDSNDPALDALLTQVVGQAAPVAMLNAAGIIGLYARAGTTALQRVDLGEAAYPAQHERGHPAPPGAARALSIMLEGRHVQLLGGLLQALTAGGYAIPAPLLPILLERGAKRAQQRPPIVAALDPAARRFAGENPAWRYASPQTDQYEGLRAYWRATSEMTERQGLLLQARVVNPTWGRRLLESSWKHLPDSARHMLIEHLRQRLSMEDEPFLEMALDDRSQHVRRKAAELLAHLVDSRLAQRMGARVGDVVHYRPDETHRVQLVFPDELSVDAVRDGVLQRKGKNRAHLRGLQLIEMVGAVPLDHWSANWGITPGEVVQAMRDSLWPRTLTQALCVAAVRQQNARWAAALLDATELHEHAVRAVPALSLDECDRLLARWDQVLANELPLSKESRLIQILRQRTGPWSAAMTRRLWRLLERQQIEENKQFDHAVNVVIKQMGLSCPPALLSEGIALFDSLPSAMKTQRALRAVRPVLAFRHAMLSELVLDDYHYPRSN